MTTTTADRHRLTRRGFLRAAAGAVVLAGVGEGIAIAVGSSSTPARPPRFHSRPDINPPPIRILRGGEQTSPGLVIQAAARTTTHGNGPMIVDNDGNLVWFQQVPHGSMNLQVMEYQGQPVLGWWEGKIVEPAGYGTGHYEIVGADYQKIASVYAGNGLTGDLHEFIITPQGTAMITAFTPLKNQDLSAVGGPKDGTLLDSVVQEVDIASGKVLFEWRASAHIALSESYANAPKLASTEWDFVHLNSIDVDDEGNLLVSARATCALYKIDRRTGAVIWRLGGRKTDFDLDDGSHFYYQHHARYHGTGIVTMFDDGAGLANVEPRSRGLKLAVDEKARTVRLLAEFLPHPSVLATSQGSMQLLPDGGAFIGWGNKPYFSEYSSNGEQRFNGRIGAGSNSYRAFRSTWLGTPTAPPDIAVERTAAKQISVFTSWNGATEVATWELLAGDSEQDLKAIATAPRASFETTFKVRSGEGYFATRARDSSGAALGTSKAIRA